ncbi:hypothetical protein [Mycobacterium stomatepiae]|uniref:hypothetical protein n=1 Tax=Mycobacterium stomatepiae TaxID=470076 RepID=UPI0013D53532|nr:hypothetical protein [Mycobacterium stomatepiae]MCV7164080.1 hypothetical protein [Mycobacterium stomatepiae]
MLWRADANPHYKRAIMSARYDRAVRLRATAMTIRTELARVPRLPLPNTVNYSTSRWIELIERVATLDCDRAARYEALTSLINSCETVIASVAHHSDSQLERLAGDLNEVMDNVAHVATRLDGARNPAEAIKRGVTDVWQELIPLRESYDEIRQAQDWIMAGDFHTTSAPTTYTSDGSASGPVLADFNEILSTFGRRFGTADWSRARDNA